MGLLSRIGRPSAFATPQSEVRRRGLRGWQPHWPFQRRALPRFLIIGAPKAGTTSLFRYLAQHPQVVEGRRKEVHYFDIHYARGEAWYRSHFPAERVLADDRITGEGSPYYLCHPQAPPRMAALLPEARLIVLLRNPVERAVSHYFHSVRNDREPLPIDGAIAAEEHRTAEVYERMRRDPSADSRQHRWFAYKGTGHYCEQLENLFQHYPREQVLILKSEDLFANPHRVFGEVCRHIGLVAEFHPPNLEPQLVGGYDQRQADPVHSSLSQYFAPRNAALYALLGRDLGWD